MIDLEAINKRYLDWYCPPDRNCCPRDGDFSGRDFRETKSHYIVRNDVPEMMDEILRLRGLLTEWVSRESPVLD